MHGLKSAKQRVGSPPQERTPKDKNTSPQLIAGKRQQGTRLAILPWPAAPGRRNGNSDVCQTVSLISFNVQFGFSPTTQRNTMLVFYLTGELGVETSLDRSAQANVQRRTPAASGCQKSMLEQHSATHPTM